MADIAATTGDTDLAKTVSAAVRELPDAVYTANQDGVQCGGYLTLPQAILDRLADGFRAYDGF